MPIITGTAGNDDLTATAAGGDTINAGAGDDYLRSGPGNDTLNGEAGNDTAAYDRLSSATITANLATGTATGLTYGTDALIGIENLTSGQGSDNLTGDDGVNVLDAGGGSNTINAGGGNDLIFDEGTASTIDAGAGNDWVYLRRYMNTPFTSTITPGSAVTLADGTTVRNAEYLQIMTGNANDHLTFINPPVVTVSPPISTSEYNCSFWYAQGGNDTLTLDLSGYGSPLTMTMRSSSDSSGGLHEVVSVLTGGCGVFTFSDVEIFELTGGSGNDQLIGITGLNVMFGGAGDDTLTGGSRDDTLEGGAGNDTLSGGAGLDTASYQHATGGVTVSLAVAGAQAVGGGQGTDTFSSIENLTGSSFDDVLTGNGGENTLTGGAGNDSLNGGDGKDLLMGGTGNDTLDGGANIDTAKFSGNSWAYTITQTTTGKFTVSGVDGTDSLSNIEYLKFDDRTMHLLPGTGTTVNWSADPSTYMTGIRDFDGNDLGGAASWKLIGTADVNGDGTAEHILFNRQIGRWAEVGTEGDGKTYFANNGWSGDTRVVGIYIDPLVANGTVVKDSDFDSQRRFQNDLFIDNIKSILGQGDYNHDGLQEIYFSLTDGTAYLHAYMHADGNIQYANYQNKQQVIDYLSGNGVASSTWSTWFPSSQTAMEVVTADSLTTSTAGGSAWTMVAGAGG